VSDALTAGQPADESLRHARPPVWPRWLREPLLHFVLLGAVLFGVGAFGVMVRRNPLVLFMCIELMLNAVNLSFVALSRTVDSIDGQTAVFFVLVVAAAEVVVGLGIIVSILRRRPGSTADDLSELRG
jgi:NADH-quinone oxidoreductase subunit K